MNPDRRPGTPRLLRALNDRSALELLLAHGPLTRAQLGELTGLSKVTASQLVERLEERGLVVRVGEQVGGRGPNAQLYAVVPSAAYVVGVHVGPKQVTAACTDITGAIHGRVEVSVHDTDDPVGVVHSAVVEAAKDAGAAMTKVHQVVLGTPGLVDPDSGDIAFAWDLEALRADLRRPVIFANDVNLAAVAEADRGAAAGVDDFVMVWVGRGLGLAIMLDGRLHHGSSGAAGEIGYLPVPGGQVPHGVSKRVKGSFQRVAGTEAVRALARARGFKAATAAGAIAAAVAAGPAGEAVLDEFATRLALGVAAVCVVIDPALVVLGGEVALAGGPALAERVEREVAAIAPVSPKVAVSGVPEDPVLHGALLTGLHSAREEIFSGE